MKILKIVLILWCIVVNRIDAAFISFIETPQAAGRGNIASTSEVSRFSPFNAGNKIVINTVYSVPFGLAELTRQSINLSFPAFSNSLILAADNFGNEIYRENSFFAAYPVFDNDIVSFVPNVQINHLSTSEKSYTAAGAGLAFLFIPVSELEIISSATNALFTPFGKESAEANYQLSFKYKPDSDFAFFLGLEKDFKTPAVVKTGTEICLLDKIHLQAGYNFAPALYTSGFDFMLSRWIFGYAFTYHDKLGFSQLAGLSYIY